MMRRDSPSHKSMVVLYHSRAQSTIDLYIYKVNGVSTVLTSNTTLRAQKY